ncbi:3-deoxy-D-manno-octulosonic acid transferase [Pseudobacter ginsenosidimutans]|uniref:3-deoxy-D-manno-octulosonic acid transferase n=1 Tax=Pseudobacter ginsenosidimutans TaxID=661488 RepID=UPI00102D8DC6|nr:glycosyltransferase N-terminal domain-containing protein [Pseudobacter ginsenosidimutans]QEC40327.1 3-deoxy-D-manno-octulosonic acid transferase [Pseudobacter ginsenosidimutans]
MHLFFYNIFCWLYRSGIRLAALWNPKARLWTKGRVNWFEQIRTQFDNPAHQWIWMHCASLGEFEQGRPVLEALRAQYPQHKILLTFFSPSGYEVRKDYKGADLITYLPMDSKANAMKFINLVNPKLVCWVKYEYWYYYLTILKKKQVPVLLVSGIFRPDQPFFKWYGRLHQYMLESFTQLFVQNEASRQLLNSIGFKKVTVNGDTRFDRVVEIANGFQPLPAIEAFCGKYPVIVAGSTWDADEEELDHYANTHPELRFIIAPHEIDAPHLHDIEQLFKHTIRYSEWSKTLQADPSVNTLIIDNIGMLSKLYHYATITYIGGGFGKDGVHNVLEAAVYGKPVVFGPVYDKFIEAAELVQAGGGISIETALELEEEFNELLQNTTAYEKAATAAARYVASKTGATNAVTTYIQENRLLTS